jgi:ribulose-bisphosphate carboxylase large chain
VTSPSLRVTYLVHASASEVASRAETLMLEQTVELPRAGLRGVPLAEPVVGQVERIEPSSDGVYHVVIAQPLATAASDPAQLLNVLYGNSSLQPDVVLADIELPDAAFGWLPGPRVGIPGIRALVGVAERPLLATALKPMGLGPDQLAALCLGFARAGLDIVKDDHGLADHPFCRFEARVEACLRAVEEAAHDSGRQTLYVPNLIGTPDHIVDQLAFARDAGVRAVMLSPMLVGLPMLHELASAADGLPVFAHPALGGVLRVREAALLGKLFRWYGADAVIFPHAGGRFAYSEATCRDVAAALRAPHATVKPSFPAPAGGIAVERAGDLLSFYGRDCILLIGGSLYEAGTSLFERTRALVAQVARATEEPVA